MSKCVSVISCSYLTHRQKNQLPCKMFFMSDYYYLMHSEVLLN